MLTPTTAEAITWCHVYDGKVHAATWTHYNRGCLTTIVEDPDDEDADYLCLGQTITTLDDLRAYGRPWRDRRLLGLPVCGHCEEDVALDEDIRDAAR